MLRHFAAGALVAAGIAFTIGTGNASAAGSWTCYGTSGSKVDPASSCSTTPSPMPVQPTWYGREHRRGSAHVAPVRSNPGRSGHHGA